MISAVVLAAGASTRFGQCKQLMPLGGKTLLEHVLDNVSASKVDDIVLVLGADAEAICGHVRFGRGRIVLNQQYSLGLSSSLQTGVRALPANTDAAMVILADQPYVSSKTLNMLVNEYQRRRSFLVIPTYKGSRGNPVLIDRSLFGEILKLRGDVGCRAIFADHWRDILKVEVDDPAVVSDIDTMEDYERLLRAD